MRLTRYEIVPERSLVSIAGSSSVHPIHAAASGLTGWVELEVGDGVELSDDLRGEVRIEVARLRSGNSLVDRETRRRVDAGRFPEIVGSVSDSEGVSAGAYHLDGEIAFRGEVRSVTGQVKVAVEEGTLTIEGVETFDVRDWGLEPPRVALLRVHPDVQVEVHIEAEAV